MNTQSVFWRSSLVGVKLFYGVCNECLPSSSTMSWFQFVLQFMTLVCCCFKVRMRSEEDMYTIVRFCCWSIYLYDVTNISKFTRKFSVFIRVVLSKDWVCLLQGYFVANFFEFPRRFGVFICVVSSEDRSSLCELLQSYFVTPFLNSLEDLMCSLCCVVHGLSRAIL